MIGPKAWVEVQPPSPAARPRRLNPILGNGKGVALPFLGGTSGRLGDSCGRPEPPRRAAHEALGVAGERALGREAGAGGDVRQGQFASQELLGPLDAAHDDVVVQRSPVAALNCRATW